MNKKITDAKNTLATLLALCATELFATGEVPEKELPDAPNEEAVRLMLKYMEEMGVPKWARSILLSKLMSNHQKFTPSSIMLLAGELKQTVDTFLELEDARPCATHKENKSDKNTSVKISRPFACCKNPDTKVEAKNEKAAFEGYKSPAADFDIDEITNMCSMYCSALSDLYQGENVPQDELRYAFERNPMDVYQHTQMINGKVSRVTIIYCEDLDVAGVFFDGQLNHLVEDPSEEFWLSVKRYNVAKL